MNIQDIGIWALRILCVSLVGYSAMIDHESVWLFILLTFISFFGMDTSEE